ncbi:MAG: 2-oxo-tetronate isomerase [Sphingomonadales bacterium]
MFKLAANLSFLFGDAAFLDRFERAAKAGFSGVEFLFPYEHDPAELKARLRSNGLEQALFNMPPGDWAAGDRGLAAVPGRESEFRASVDEALRHADALDCRRVHVMSGVADGEEALGAYLRNLEYVAARFAAAGVTVLIEPINRRDMPGYFLADFGVALAVCGAIENVALQFDLYHRQIIHGDVITGLNEAMPVIRHMQIAGVPGRNEPDTGELDLGRVLGAVRDLGYDGWIGCEYRPKGTTEDGLGWARDLL